MLSSYSNLPLIVGVLAGIAVFTLVLGVGNELFERLRSPLERIERAPQADNPANSDADGQISAKLDRLAKRTPLATTLIQAGVRITPAEYMTAVAVMLAISLLLALWLHNPLLGMVLLASITFGPRRWLDWRRTKRGRDFNAQLPAMVELLTSSMRAGQGLQQALALAVQECEPPMSVELDKVYRNWQLRGAEEALEIFNEEMHSDDLDMVITALLVQMKAGGDIAHMLDSISGTIRQRIAQKGDIRALTSQQQMSGLVLGFMPVALALGLLIFNPHYITNVFQTTQWCGWLMFTVAGVMMVSGIVVMRRVVDVRV